LKTFIISLLTVTVLAGCMPDTNSTSDSKTAKEQEALVEEGVNQTGMPAIVNFQERKLMKMIYEKRDQADLITYTYIVDMQGKRHFLTKSMGFGLPYGTQYSNPEKLTYIYNHGYFTLPQAEPNSLFMPDSAAATWVMAIPPNGGEPQPMYVEDNILVSLWPLTEN